MARHLRIIIENGIYHVYNRGNYRAPIFESAGARLSFEKTLFEAAERFGWVIYAFAIMGNHFHIAFRITRPNLPESLAWLQATFAVRFNRFRNESGHVFNGRYHALLVQPGANLRRVVNYIHLNPVEAGVIALDQLATCRWTSLKWFRSSDCPGFLNSDWLADLAYPANKIGWGQYLKMLRLIHGSPVLQSENRFDEMEKGWAIGDPEWKAQVIVDERNEARLSAPCGPERDAMRQQTWMEHLHTLVVRSGTSLDTIRAEPKCSETKVALARALRDECDASYSWIATALAAGTAATLRHRVYLLRRK